MQASGPPDTHRDGDHSSAWAPAVRNGGLEWIELTYGLRVVPTQVCIRETYNPGFVTKVEADDAGTWRELWSGHDPTAESPGIFSPPLSGNTFATTRIRITIDTSVSGWNEIDAVELVGSVR